MKVAVGADHAGFRLKERVAELLREQGHEVEDFGTDSTDSVDYPDFAEKTAWAVSSGHANRGILICSSGIGMSIAANKVPGVRAGLGANEEAVRLARAHNDANVLTLGAKFVGEEQALRMVNQFLEVEFDGGRHQRRVGKIAEMERAGSVPA